MARRQDEEHQGPPERRVGVHQPVAHPLDEVLRERPERLGEAHQGVPSQPGEERRQSEQPDEPVQPRWGEWPPGEQFGLQCSPCAALQVFGL